LLHCKDPQDFDLVHPLPYMPLADYWPGHWTVSGVTDGGQGGQLPSPSGSSDVGPVLEMGPP